MATVSFTKITEIAIRFSQPRVDIDYALFRIVSKI